jgi:outer membrane protein assembly factor BamE (lipoprotein component of BamABCDE complex)
MTSKILPVIYSSAWPLSGCTPMLATRGNFLEDEQLKTVQVGVSSKAEVEQKLGSPTTTDPFDNKKWFYIGEKTSARAFFKSRGSGPPCHDRANSTKTTFCKSANELDEKSGKQIEMVKKTTPAPGREMNAFEQFVNNIGKFNKQGGVGRGIGAPGGN